MLLSATDFSEFKSQLTTKSLITGIYCGFICVLLSVSYASLIFSGRLSEFIPLGINIALSSVIIAGLITAFGSSFQQTILQIDDDTAPVFALLISSVTTTLVNPDSSTILSVILFTIFVATFILGITLFAVAFFNVGRFIQYLPYSVMGGYFAAVGWLLCLGAFTVATGIEMESFQSVKTLFSWQNLSQWLPVILIGLWLHKMRNRIPKTILIGGTIIFAITTFFVAQSLFNGLSPDNLMQRGDLIGPFKNQNMQLIDIARMTTVDFSHINLMSENLGTLASLLLISLLSIILCISGLGLHTMRDIDLNHELKVAGVANIASAVGGGMSALPSLTVSQLSLDLHPRNSRIVAFVTILFCLVCFYFALGLIAYIPRIILAGLLFSIGLGFISAWLIDGLKKFGPLEYSVIPIILLTSMFFGFIESIAIGIIAAIVLFVIRYSAVQVIRYEASGSGLSSNLIRSYAEVNYLKKHGKKFYLLSLQGYLFFGSSGNLQSRAMELINDPDNAHIEYLILDFNQTQGVDASATLNLQKLKQQLSAKGICLVLTNLSDENIEMLKRGGLDFEQETRWLSRHADLDRGIEWCEQQILSQAKEKLDDQISIFQRLNEVMKNKMALLKIDQYLKKRKVKAGQRIATIGEESDELIFLQSCSASAFIIDQSGNERRVAGANMGTVFGEIGFFLDIPRTATVRADSSGYIYTLNKDSLAEMEINDPELAQAITKYITMIVSERLMSTTASLRSIM